MRVCNEKSCYWHVLYRDKHVEHNLKDIIHQILEDRKGISKTKRQNQIFVMACRSIKGNLLLISHFNSNKTVCITEVERKKNLCSFFAIKLRGRGYLFLMVTSV